LHQVTLTEFPAIIGTVLAISWFLLAGLAFLYSLGLQMGASLMPRPAQADAAILDGRRGLLSRLSGLLGPESAEASFDTSGT
jgi:hypothetical protein